MISCPQSILPISPQSLAFYVKMYWVPSITNQKAKLYLFELKEKGNVTSTLLQDCCQEDMEVPKAVKNILSEDFGNSLQNTEEMKIK